MPTLSEYIDQIGDEAAAALFQVKTRTAAAWRRGERTPRPEKADFIVEITKGRVTYEGIYGRRSNNTRRRQVSVPQEGTRDV